MSSTIPKMILVWLCISIVLYGFGVRVMEGDILDKFVAFDGDTVTGLSSNFSSVIPTQAESNTILGSSSTFVFIDGLKLIWSFITFMINIAVAPIGLLTFLEVPPFIVLALGVPSAVMFIVAIILFIRGVT